MLKVFAVLLVLMCPLLAQAAQPTSTSPQRIQCWTDEKGVRSCGDHVPPQYAKQERDVYNSQGVVVDRKDRQRTPDEISADERRAAEDAVAAKHAQEQKAYDKFLTDTYSSSKEIEDARILREQTVDGRLSLVQKAIADNEKTLVELHGRVDSIKKAGKQPDKRLQDQIKKFEDSLADHKQSVGQLQEEKEKMVAKFNEDIERYKMLRPGY